MPKFRDFQAAVFVDGVKLSEYTIQEEDGEISCYIPSEVGKSFAVRWRDLNLQRNTVGKVHLDGVLARNIGIIKSTKPREASASFYRVTSETVRPFCFAHLSLTDDESCTNPAGNNLGEVRIELYELVSGNLVPYRPLKYRQVPGVVKIHEYSKKAMTHCVGYGDDMKKRPRASRKMIADVVKGKRLATFIFRYRALDMLQAQGIAPPPPQPVPFIQREKKRQRYKEEDTAEDMNDGEADKRQRCKEEDTTEDIDDGEADKAMLKILKAEISKIEARLLKRQKTAVKSEDKADVIANEVVELD